MSINVVIDKSAMAEVASFGSKVTCKLAMFKKECDVIIANRMTDEI